MCRSCHTPAEEPDAAGVLTDCAQCHLPEVTFPSLRPLLPAGAIRPKFEFNPQVPEAERGLLIEQFREGLDTYDISAGGLDPGAVPVSVKVTVEVGVGQTATGDAYLAVRAHASFQMHRVKVDVSSAPAVGTERDKLVKAALADMMERLTDALGQ